eukprot:4723606-Prymnesium_polylepis.1
MDSICQQDGIDYYAADTATTAARLFVELDTEQINKLDVENLVAVAVEYFSTQLTVQPEKWIRTQIEKQDEDRDGWLDQEQFERAVWRVASRLPFNLLVRAMTGNTRNRMRHGNYWCGCRGCLDGGSGGHGWVGGRHSTEDHMSA